MRRTALPLVVALLAAACSRSDAPADTTAVAGDSAPPAAAAPAAATLTPAQISGEWAGTSYMANSDSVAARWTIRQTTDSTAVLTYDGTGTPVNYRTTFAGDSMVGVSEPYTLPTAGAGSPKVTFHTIGRLSGDSLVGVSHVMLADKPDSVVRTSRWVAKRKP